MGGKTVFFWNSDYLENCAWFFVVDGYWKYLYPIENILSVPFEVSYFDEEFCQVVFIDFILLF